MSGKAVISQHIDSLDGLRAIAILLVLLVHSGLYYLVDIVPSGSSWQYVVVNGRSGSRSLLCSLRFSNYRDSARHAASQRLFSTLLLAASAANLAGVLRLSFCGVPAPSPCIHRDGPVAVRALLSEFPAIGRSFRRVFWPILELVRRGAILFGMAFDRLFLAEASTTAVGCNPDCDSAAIAVYFDASRDE